MMNGEVQLGRRDGKAGDEVPSFRPGVADACTELHRRSGVALILVIGMLGLMVVLAISFAVYMRTERVAAGSYKNSVIARQLLPVALNRALEAINSNPGNSPYPMWPYLASPGTAFSIAANTNLLAWIPQAALGGTLPSPGWISLAGVDGRVGYLVVNCSGFIDANTAGGAARSIGTNVVEIQMPAEVLNPASLPATSETLQELNVKGIAAGALAGNASNLVVFSAFPRNYQGGTNLPALVDLSGDETALAGRRTEIINALVASGIAADQVAFVFTNLLDYVDADNIPKDLASACTEAVPMFNEIVVRPSYRFDSGTNCRVTGIMQFEWFYPFSRAPSVSNYWIECNVLFTNMAGAGLPVPMPISTNISASFNGMAYPITCPYVNISAGPTNYTIGAALQLRASVQLKMHSGTTGGPVVDAAPASATTTIDLDLPTVASPAPPVAGITTVQLVTNKECVDPRFNWLPSLAHWSYGTALTVGGVNARSVEYMSGSGMYGSVGLNSDQNYEMHVADRPLSSVTELTYLLRGQTLMSYRWSTIRLFSKGGSVDRVCDYFALGTNTTIKGFVNPNSGDTGALEALFRDMPLNNYPGDPAPRVLTPSEARALAAFWVNTNQNNSLGSFANLSDIGKATNVFSYLPAGLTAFQKEAFFRNTVGLFNPRQQYFVILLFAQAAKVVPNMGVSVLSDLKAVAEVWRDPLANAEGIHPVMIRMVHIPSND